MEKRKVTIYLVFQSLSLVWNSFDHHYLLYYLCELILQFGKLFLRQIKPRVPMGLQSHSQNIYIGPTFKFFSNLPDSSKNSLSLLLGSSLHFKIIYPRQEPSVRANFLSPALCNPRFQHSCYLSGDCPTEVEVSEHSHISLNQF